MKLRCLALLMLCLAAAPAMAAEPLTIGAGALGNIFTLGEPVAIPVRSGAGDLRWSIRDFFGAEVEAGTTHVQDGSARIEPRIRTPGYFTLEIATEPAGPSAIQARAALAVVPRPDPKASTSPFGVVTHFAKGWATDIIPLIEKAGLVHIRDEQPWRLVERQPGRYEFPPRLSAFMAELTARHIDPLIVLAFSNPLYDGDQTPFSDAGRDGYGAYARAVAERYAGGLSAVEIWNEYNGSFCTGPCKSDRPAHYTAMLQQAYKSLKAADPSLTVLGGAAVPIPLDYFRALFDKGALGAMDAVVIHPYRREPEGVERQIDSLRQMMARYGTPKPIWATEFADTADMRKSRDDVARYLVRMSTLLLSAKVERFYWYLLRDYQQFSGLGLLRDEKDPLGRYAPNPAYVAYATLIHQLGSAHFLRREEGDPRLHAYLFTDGAREVRVLWASEAGVAYELTSASPVRRISVMGAETTLTPRSGRVSVEIDRNPVYLIGNAR